MKTRTDLTARLLQLPTALRAAEEAYLEAASVHLQAKLALDCREADLLLAGVEGGNAETRKARLHVGTLQHQEKAQEAAEEKERAALAVRCLMVELRALEGCTRLLAGGAGDGAGAGEGGDGE